DINSNVEDMSRWVRLQLGGGSFEGRSIVSPDNLAFTRTPKVGLNDKMSYALGWSISATPNGDIAWHDGDTLSFGSFVGLAPDRSVGLVTLRKKRKGVFPAALGQGVWDGFCGNPRRDQVGNGQKKARASFGAAARVFAGPPTPRPFPPLAPLAGNFVNPSFGA